MVRVGRALAFLVLVCWAAAPQRLHGADGGTPATPRRPVEQAVVELANMDPEFGQLFDEAQANLEKQDFGKVFEGLQRVLSSQKTALSRMPDETDRYVAPRTIANLLMAQLPPAMLERYEKTEGAAARRLYEEGERTGSEAVLWRVADQYFHTEAGAQALNLLATLRFDRGGFLQAGRAWERLARFHRSAKLDRGLLLTKAAVAYQLGGDAEKAKEIQEALATQFPNAEAVVAGQKTSLADVVRRALTHAAHPSSQREVLKEWPCLAGTPAGTGLQVEVPGTGLPVWVYPPTTEARLARLNAFLRYSTNPEKGYAVIKTALDAGRGIVSVVRAGRPKITVAAPALAHAVTQAGFVIHRDAEELVGQDPVSGTVLWRMPLPLYARVPPGAGLDNPYLPFAGDLGRYTLSAGDGHLYVTYGYKLNGPGIPTYEGAEMDGSKLCAIRLGLSEEERKVVWQVGGGKGDNDIVRAGKYLTAPTYLAGRLFAMVRYAAAYYTVCLDARTGNTLWTTLLGPVPITAFRAQAWEFGYTIEVFTERGSPPAVAEGLVFAATNTGLITALEMETGRPLWAYAYPIQVSLRKFTISELSYTHMLAYRPRYGQNPLVVSRGRVIAAPGDSDFVLALEAETGRLLWSVDRAGQYDLSAVDVERVLLSGPDLVVLSTRDGSVVKKLAAGDVTGRPAVTPKAAWASGAGRLLRLDLQNYALTPAPVTDREAVLGNLVSCDGLLIAAGACGLTGFLEPGGGAEFLKARLAQSKQAGERFGLLVRCGQLALAAGKRGEAEASFRAAEQEAAKAPGAKLESQLRPWLYQVSVRRMAETTEAAEGDKALADARKYAGEPRAEMAAILLAMRVHEKQKRPEKAIELAQMLSEKFAEVEARENELLASVQAGPAAAAPELPVSGYCLGQRHVERLIRTAGKEVYAAFDAAARRALDEGRRKKSVPALLEAQRRYPHSACAGETLLAAAELLCAEALSGRRPEAGGSKPPLLNPQPSTLNPELLRAARILNEAGNYAVTAGLRPEAGGPKPPLLSPQPSTLNPELLRLGQVLVTSRLAPQLLPLLYGEARATPAGTFGGVKVDPQALLSAERSGPPLPEYPLSAAAPCGVPGPVEEVYRLPGEAYGVLRTTDYRPLVMGERVVLRKDNALVCLDLRRDDLKSGTVWTAPCKSSLRTYCAGHWTMDLRHLAVFDRQWLAVHDALTGKLKKEVKLADWDIADWYDAVADGNSLVFCSYWGRLVCVDLAGPSIRWQYTPDRPGSGKRMEIARGVLMLKEISSRGEPPHGNGICHDVQDGRCLFSPKNRNWKAMLNEDGLAVYNAADGLYVQDPWQASKAPLWSYDFKTAPPMQLLAVGGRHMVLFSTAPEEGLEVLDLAAPATRTPIKSEGAVVGVSVAGSAVYVLSGKASGGQVGRYVKLLAPLVAAYELQGSGGSGQEMVRSPASQVRSPEKPGDSELRTPNSGLKLLWRRELVASSEGYCQCSWLQSHDGCLSLTLVPADLWKPGRAWVVDAQTGVATEMAPATPTDWGLGTGDWGQGASRHESPAPSPQPRAPSLRDCDVPVVVNGRVLLHAGEALVVFRSRL